MINMHLSYNRYAIASILSPIIAGIIIVAYQSIAYSEFWGAINNANDTHNAEGAMMAIAEIIEIVIALAIGSFIGIIIAIKSIRLNTAKIGVFALILNSVPFLLLSFFWVNGIIYGI